MLLFLNSRVTKNAIRHCQVFHKYFVSYPRSCAFTLRSASTFFRSLRKACCYTILPPRWKCDTSVYPLLVWVRLLGLALPRLKVIQAIGSLRRFRIRAHSHQQFSNRNNMVQGGRQNPQVWRQELRLIPFCHGQLQMRSSLDYLTEEKPCLCP